MSRPTWQPRRRRTSRSSWCFEKICSELKKLHSIPIVQGRNFPDRLVGAMTCLLSLEGPSLEVVDRDDESRTGVMRKRKHSPEGGSGHVDPLSDLYAVLETYP